MRKELIVKINELISPILEILGYELWGCELKGLGGQTILRIYIDSEQGVTLEDCGKVSNQLSGVLDVEDLIDGRYDLEVSSPGLDRILFKEEHYEKFIGSIVQIKLRVAINGRRNYKGVIKSVADGIVNVLVDDKSFALPIADVEQAKIVQKF
jgi:ribosome maturation factor RimP